MDRRTKKLVKKTKLKEKFERYDISIENTHSYIASGVVVHNTNCRLGYIKEGDEWIQMAGSHNTRRRSYPIIDGIHYKNVPSLYWMPFSWYPALKSMMHGAKQSFIVYGEIFGPGVQDMTYGLQNKDFRVFDIKIDGQYMHYNDMVDLCNKYGIPTVPLLYKGPYSADVIKEYTDGKTTFKGVTGKFKGREGIVIKPQVERIEPDIGRVIFRSVSADYLERRTSDGH